MLFPWSHAARRRELLSSPFPAEWERILTRAAFYSRLLNPQQGQVRDVVRVLIAEKSWEGVGGLTLTDEIKVTIAGQAARLVLGFDSDYFPNVESILVYPQGFLVKVQRRGLNGALVEETVPYAGEAALSGPVVLSWEDVRHAGGGHNVVLHEFAHKLDMRDGAADGAPYLKDRAQIDDWAQVMSAEYQQLAAQTQAGEPTLLDPYGATNAAEFFAVATECFFELPGPLRQHHPDLYRVLAGYYQQEPVG